MALPSTGERSDAQCYLLRKIEKQYSEKFVFVYPPNWVGRIFHDFARCAMTEDFLKSDCDVMWFLDADIVPHPDIMNVFDKYEEWEMAGAPYPVFMTPPGENDPAIVYTVYKLVNGKMAAAPVPTSGSEYVDGIATGCIFLKRSVFDKLEKPYFEFKYDPETRRLIEGEDLGFCKKTAALGKQFYIDYSLVCKHFKKVELLDINDYCIRLQNKAVLRYDQMLRQSIAKKKLDL